MHFFMGPTAAGGKGMHFYLGPTATGGKSMHFYLGRRENYTFLLGSQRDPAQPGTACNRARRHHSTARFYFLALKSACMDSRNHKSCVFALPHSTGLVLTLSSVKKHRIYQRGGRTPPRDVKLSDRPTHSSALFSTTYFRIAKNG